jgi:hypothetical protein
VTTCTVPKAPNYASTDMTSGEGELPLLGCFRTDHINTTTDNFVSVTFNYCGIYNQWQETTDKQTFTRLQLLMAL